MRNDHDDLHPVRRFWQSLGLLGFGLAVLGFLIAIERPHWFSIKPMTGTAAAMAHAADSGPGKG